MAYSSSGANLDFVKHRNADADPDLVAGYLCDILAKDAPVIALEKSLTITGLLQNLTYDAPRVADTNMGAPLALVGVELAIQLNNLAIPNSDFKFTIQYRDMLGNVIDSMTQEVTGTASVEGQNTRQYLRFLAFQRFGSFTDGGAVTFQDGRSMRFPSFCSLAPADLAALQAVFAGSLAGQIWPDLRYTVSQIDVLIPAAAITAGVVVTCTPIVSGRQEPIEAIISSLDNLGAAVSQPADKSNLSTKLLG